MSPFYIVYNKFFVNIRYSTIGFSKVNVDSCILCCVLRIAVSPYIFLEPVKITVPCLADSSTNTQNIRLQYIDHIDNSFSQIFHIPCNRFFCNPVMFPESMLLTNAPASNFVLQNPPKVHARTRIKMAETIILNP